MSHHGAFAVLGFCGLVVLSACGSGGPPSQVAVRVGSVVHVGPYTQEFASPLPASAAQAAVVEGFREGQVLWEKSQNAQHLVAPVRDYVTGQALSRLTATIKAGKERGIVPAGTDRMFNTRVTAIGGRTATLATCDDGSRFKDVNPRTGKVDLSFEPTPGQSYLSESWRMVRLSGHWAITALSVASLPSRNAEPCQPGMTGYGPSSRPSVAVLLREMTAALRTASSVHISGAVQQGGKALGLDLGITRSGEFTGQFSENGATFTVLATHGHSYLRLTSALVRLSQLPATVCSRFCGKYLEYPAARAHALFAHLNMASLTRSMTSTPAREVTLLGAVTLNGQPAWLLQDSHQNSLYVAARGKPYILRAVGPPPGQDAANLTQWNAVRIPGPPPASQVVKLSQLAG